MRQRDIPVVPNVQDLLDSFQKFMRGKPVKMRNTYWRAYLDAWVNATKTEESK